MQLILSNDSYYTNSLAKSIIDKFEKILSEDAIVYYEYPFVLDNDNCVLRPSLLIVDKSYSVLLIHCVNDKISNIDDIIDSLDIIESTLMSRFIKSTSTNIKKDRRSLRFSINSCIIVNPDNDFDRDNKMFPIYNNPEDVLTFISEEKTCLSQNTINEIQSIIEGSTAIIKPKERKLKEEDKNTKAYFLKLMEEQIAVMDMEQKHAAISQLRGPQRIRGLAGSGKTIILCLKAVYLHLLYPEANILYTFTTKSLYDFIERTITRFYKYFGDGKLPDFEKIQIKHAWGGRNVPGVYYDVAIENGFIPKNYGEVKAISKMKLDPFDYVCDDLLNKSEAKLKKQYDYILIDEAQDFKPSFYKLCRAIVKDDCLVWCYDDLQNIFDVQIQNEIETFKDSHWKNSINLEELRKNHKEINNDIILEKTYRNPKQILVMAHAIGFGIYNKDIIQKLETNQHWEDLGYNVIQGDCQVVGSEMVIERPDKNSPLLINELEKPENIIKYYSCENLNDEINAVVKSIVNDILVDKLKPDDIVVITLDDLNAKGVFVELQKRLLEYEIMSYNLTSNEYLKGFYKEGMVTLSTLYKAKGNESAMVYIICSEIFNKNPNSRSIRNKIFTSFTRAKGWLRIYGENCQEGQLYKEIQDVINNDYRLKFEQPKEAFAIKRYGKRKNKKEKEELLKLKQQLDKYEKMGIKKEELLDMLYNNSLIGDDYDGSEI